MRDLRCSAHFVSGQDSTLLIAITIVGVTVVLLALRNMNLRRRHITLRDSETKYPLPLIEKEVEGSACEREDKSGGECAGGKAGQWERHLLASSLHPSACVCVCVCWDCVCVCVCWDHTK